MKKNVDGINLIKILAVFLVMCIHQLGRIGFYTTIVGSSNTMTLLTILYPLLLSCVPLFLIATGYLLSERTITLSHYWKISTFLIEVAVTLLITQISLTLFNTEQAPLSFLAALTKNFSNPPYYIGLYFSLYLISPFFNHLFHSLDTKQKRLLCLICLITICAPSFINNLFSISLMESRFSHMWIVLYYFIGLMIKDFKPHLKSVHGFLILAVTGCLYATFVWFMRNGYSYDYKGVIILGYYENIFTVVASTTIFICLYSIKFQTNMIRFICRNLSKLSLTFYLISGLFSDSIAITIYPPTPLLKTNLISLLIIPFMSFILALPVALLCKCITQQIFLLLKFLHK